MEIIRVNIGEVIRQKVEEIGLSKAEFAKRLNIQRQNIEKTVFQKHSIDTDLLCNICELLDCNLFNYFIPKGLCNISDYTSEAKVSFTIEAGTEKKNVVYKLRYGENKFEITPND